MQLPLPWLEAGEAFPPIESAWGLQTPLPGLLAAGGELDHPTLLRAYSAGIFPWFSQGQPTLWWSTDPRMVLRTRGLVLHHSLHKKIRSLLRQQRLRIEFDQDFDQVIAACAHTPRPGQGGTWILPDIQAAYLTLHQLGHAHCVTAWIDGRLAGGLYCVSLGAMVFGESMFSHQSDGSKIALTALVAFCRAHRMPWIDCQQETPHLASMGARALPRPRFKRGLQAALKRPGPSPTGSAAPNPHRPAWQFDPLYWSLVLSGADRMRDESGAGG